MKPTPIMPNDPVAEFARRVHQRMNLRGACSYPDAAAALRSLTHRPDHTTLTNR